MQEHLTTVTQKGQVTIPLAIRQLLGIKPSDRVRFRVTEGRVELLPVDITLESAYGAVKPLSRPTNWKVVRRQAREERVQYRISKTKKQRKGAR
jgi:AbrB family looped-hinge helix DNA binding protein